MILAVDIGGTKTLIAVFNSKGEIKEQLRFPTPHNYDDFIRELAANVAKLSTKDFVKAGVAFPGKVDRVHGVGLACGNLPWVNVPLQADCERVLMCPVIIENDANLAGLSEAHLVKNDFRKVLYVTISTGIGGGFIIDDIIAPDFADSEIGQILLEYQGHLRRWEDFASGSAIVEHFGKRASEITDPKNWYVIARNIAVGLIDLIATLTPDLVIIGGGVGSHFDKFKDRLNEELKIYENPMISVPPIRQAARAEEAVVYGCYLMTQPSYAKNR